MEKIDLTMESAGNIAVFTLAIFSALVFALFGPENFLILSVAILIMFLVAFKPFYGLCFLAISIPYAGLLQIVPDLTANKIFAVWVFISFILGILLKKEKLGVFSSDTIKFYLLFHAYLILIFPFRNITTDSIEAIFSKTFLLGLVLLIALIPRNYREFKIICIVSAAGSAFLGIYIALFGMGKMIGEFGTRLSAGTNENVLSHALAVGLLLSIFAFRDSSRRLKTIILILDAFSVYAILLTGSRGTWVALIISFALLPLFAPNIPFKKRLNYFLVGTFAVSTVVLGLTYDLFGQWGQLVMDRILEHDSMSQAAGGRMDYFWPYYLNKFFEKPILGWGIGAYSSFALKSAHNDFVWTMAETGTIGTILFLVFHVYILKDILKNKDKTLSLQALILFVFLVFGGLTHNTLTLKSYALAIGVLCLLAKISKLEAPSKRFQARGVGKLQMHAIRSQAWH